MSNFFKNIEHLLRQLRHRERAVLLRAARRERREADHEEVEAREGDHVDRQLAQVAVELAREAEAARGGRHHGGDQVVEVTERGRRELQGAEAVSGEGARSVRDASDGLGSGQESETVRSFELASGERRRHERPDGRRMGEARRRTRCRREPRCRGGVTRPSSRRAGGRRARSCTARQRCRTPWVTGRRSRCT